MLWQTRARWFEVLDPPLRPAGDAPPLTGWSGGAYCWRTWDDDGLQALAAARGTARPPLPAGSCRALGIADLHHLDLLHPRRRAQPDRVAR